jgi:hypothetical protein
MSLEELIPILYLKGISTGDFEEALAALVGKQECARSFGIDDCPPQGGVERGARALAQARPLVEALRLFLGRRHPLAGAA